jgi:hypothetical protein
MERGVEFSIIARLALTLKGRPNEGVSPQRRLDKNDQNM